MIIVIVIVLVPVFRKSHDQTFHIVVFFFFRDIHNHFVHSVKAHKSFVQS